MKIRLLKLCLIMALVCPAVMFGQRIQQPLGRGVVAVKRGTNVLVSWRKLAQENEKCTYNLYKRTTGGGSYSKINANPLSLTNYLSSTTEIPFNTDLAISVINNGVEGEISTPFSFKEQAWNNVYADINFENNVVKANDYKAKYCWPADLDGDGEYDFIVDRLSQNLDSTSHKIQAYLRDGTCLWTVDMGPNINIDAGQNDMVIAYDINCDGKAEVIIKSSDGTRFWDKNSNTWGKYVFGKETADVDGDGIIDYTKQTVRNAPFYVTVINGMTGEEMTSAELDYSQVHDGVDTYTRDNKADYMGDDYSCMHGHFAICYFDGVHPSLAMECLDRTASTQVHHNYVFAFGYDWNNGTPSNWHHYYTWSRNDKTPWPAEFHQLRVCDVDGNGIDEMLQGGYGVNPVNNMVFSAGIGHGDRYRVSDIDPDRPGLETYAIQQSDLLGQLIYDAATGTHIKEWYLPSVSDVGRGECMDVDPAHKGYEIYSTMQNLYDCKGNVIKEGDTPFPYEGIWWDGDLGRETLGSPGGSNYGSNVLISDYDQIKGDRQINISSESNWAVHAGPAVRPLFFGDIAGDWREEVVLAKQNATSSTGFVAYSTDKPSDYSLYCLQEDPHYRLDCTTRGYYQSPNTDFYLGYDMPYPPLPPDMVTDLRWKSGTEWNTSSSNFLTFDEKSSQSFADSKSVLFDISGDNNNTINITSDVKPSIVYFMAPKNHDYTFGGNGKIKASENIWKSMQGVVTLNNISAAKTIISEGTLVVNGTIDGPVDLRAKGTLAGDAVLNDTIHFEGGLNYEGCRLAPGANTFGTMTFNKNVTLTGNVYVESNLQTAGSAKCDLIKVNGDLTMKGNNIFTIIPSESTPAEGEYVLAECTGTLTADPATISVKGLVGLKYNISVKGKQLVLSINGVRDPATVVWTGAKNTNWDYQTDNFNLSGDASSFVAKDSVVFNDAATLTNVNLVDTMVTKGVTFTNDKLAYTIDGVGAIGGENGLTKTGKGLLTLNAKNSYKGATIIKGGKVVVKELAFGGVISSLGASSSDAKNLQVSNAILEFSNANAATDRSMTIGDTVTVNVTKGTTSFNGNIIGDGVFVKTGDGQFNFNYAGANTFKAMVLKGGIIAQGDYRSTFGNVGCPFLFNGGTVVMIANKNFGTIPDFNYATTVGAGVNTLKMSYRSYFSGSVTGTGTLNVAIGGGLRCDIFSDFSAFTGKLEISGGGARFTQSEDLSNATVQLDAKSSISHNKLGGKDALPNVESKIGAISSTESTASLSSGIFSVGYNNADATFAGTFTSTAINKYGTSAWTLTGSGSTSPVNVYAGVLRVANASGELTSGKVTVADKAVVDGTGTVKDVDVQNGGTLTAGSSDNDCQTLTIENSLTMASGSTLKVEVGAATNDQFAVSGTGTFSGNTIDIVLTASRNWQPGDEITVFPSTGTLSGTYTIHCDGITWDDSTLLTDGKLKVKTVSTGITGINADEIVDVYNTSGMKIRSQVAFGKALDSLAPGVYIINGQKVTKK